MSKETPAGELTDSAIRGLWSEFMYLHRGEMHQQKAMLAFTRAIIAADRELRRGDALMPVVGKINVSDEDDCWFYRHVDDQTPAGSFPLVKQSDAQAALAAKDATHEKQVNACKSLIQSLENQRTTLREGAEKWAEAVKSLLSEREANSLLTNEIDALTAERDALKVDAERLDWVALQDLSEFDIQFIFDAPHEGEYSVGTECGTFYGLTLREAIDAAMAKAVQP